MEKPVALAFLERCVRRSMSEFFLASEPAVRDEDWDAIALRALRIHLCGYLKVRVSSFGPNLPENPRIITSTGDSAAIAGKIAAKDSGFAAYRMALGLYDCLDSGDPINAGRQIVETLTDLPPFHLDRAHQDLGTYTYIAQGVPFSDGSRFSDGSGFAFSNEDFVGTELWSEEAFPNQAYIKDGTPQTLLSYIGTTISRLCRGTCKPC